MLETIREYAAELLEASGEAEPIRRRHCEHILGRAEAGTAAWTAGADPQESLFRILEEEHDNLRAALEWAAAAGELELEVRLAVAARWYWVVLGHLSEGRRFYDGIFERTVGAPDELRARALVHGAIFPSRQGDLATAEKLLQESLDLYRALGDEQEIARATAELGGIAIARMDLDRAETLYEECIPLLQAQLPSNPLAAGRLATAFGNLGTIAHMRGDPAGAVGRYREALDVLRMTSDHDAVAVNLHNLGRSELALGHTREGYEALCESLAIARRLGYREVIAYILGGFAEVAMIEGDAQRAANLLGASEQLFAEIGRVPDPDEAQVQARVAAFVTETLGEGEAARLRAQGASQSLEELLDRVASPT
jgi:tetratricopeptide (TPR) repeat protein